MMDKIIGGIMLFVAVFYILPALVKTAIDILQS